MDASSGIARRMRREGKSAGLDIVAGHAITTTADRVAEQRRLWPDLSIDVRGRWGVLSVNGYRENTIRTRRDSANYSAVHRRLQTGQQRSDAWARQGKGVALRLNAQSASVKFSRLAGARAGSRVVSRARRYRHGKDCRQPPEVTGRVELRRHLLIQP